MVVTQLDPMTIIFTLPQDDLPQINKEIGAGLNIEAYDRDGDKLLGRGKLTLIDNQVNVTTATVRLKGTVPNPDKALWPNEFVRARLVLAVRSQVLAIPAPAVQRGPQGTFVYIVMPDQTAALRTVQVDTVQEQWAIIKGGIQAGDKVVIEGQNQLRLGREGGASARPPPATQTKALPALRIPCLIPTNLAHTKKESTAEPRREHFRTVRAASSSDDATGSWHLDRRHRRVPLSLPVSALPQVDYPTIVVSTSMPGASGQTMSATVTTPLERQFGQMPSLSLMTSVSSFGSSQITLQFTLDRDIDAAEQDGRSGDQRGREFAAQNALPTPPSYSKSNPADTPILTLSVSSDTLALSQVDDYADSILAQKISQVSGVGLVTLNGGQKPAVRLQVDPQSLAGTGAQLGRTCALPSWRRTSISPKARSTGRARATPSPRTTSCTKPSRFDR